MKTPPVKRLEPACPTPPHLTVAALTEDMQRGSRGMMAHAPGSYDHEHARSRRDAARLCLKLAQEATEHGTPHARMEASRLLRRRALSEIRSFRNVRDRVANGTWRGSMTMDQERELFALYVRPLLQLARHLRHQPAPTPQFRHEARGTYYRALGLAGVQASTRPLQEGDCVMVYQGQDGRLHVRLAAEFMDGRFLPINPSALEAQEATLKLISELHPA